MSDYTYWQNALKGNFGPIHEDVVHPGFYRKRLESGGRFIPVAIWDDAGTLRCLVGNFEKDPVAEWTYCCRYPVTEEAYRAHMDGQPWPDMDEAAEASIGHNKGPTDEAEILKGQIEAASAGVSQYETISDDITASKAQSLRSRLLELSGEADKKREALVRPHLDAQKSINGIWMPLVKEAKAGADVIAKSVGKHETRKAQEAERIRQAALKAQRENAPAVPPAPPIEVPAATIRGAYGRAASVRVVKVATVVDQDAAYAALSKDPELVALIAKLAQRAINAGLTIPGVSVTEERKIT